MKQCPKCLKAAKTSERIEPDPKKKDKLWLITFCAKCGYNYDIEEYKEKILSPEEEMDKFPWSAPKKPWPYI